MREGELFGLRQHDVNWKTNEITVRRSWDGETTKSRRDLVIPIAMNLERSMLQLRRVRTR
jgi:hypothetical protein